MSGIAWASPVVPAGVLAGALAPGADRHRIAPMAHTRNTRAARSVVRMQDRPGPDDTQPDDKPKASSLGGVVDLVQGLRRFAGIGVGRGFDLTLDGLEVTATDEKEAGYTPLVLVVGASGRTGRIVVRKLLFRGFRVRVLVRNLYTSTLDLLGTGCNFVQGDVLDRQSLIQATQEVDKIIFAASVEAEGDKDTHFLDGVRNVLGAFHDSRHFDFGEEGATKRTLFKFSKPKHLSSFVPESEDSVVREFGMVATKPSRVSWMPNGKKHAVFVGKVFDVYNGSAAVVCKGEDNADVMAAIRENSGLVLRCIGDGKAYSVVLRTQAGNAAGVEYESSFTTSGKWDTVRLPFSNFREVRTTFAKDDEDDDLSIPFDRRTVVELMLQYRKPEINPEKEDGNFYLATDYIKAYQTQPEPDFVLLSCAKAANESATDDSTKAPKGRVEAEELVRKSGLTYTIVRPGNLSDQPGGNRALVLRQGSGLGNTKNEVSRADVAEVCVSSLLDPRASNITFEAFESVYAPTAKRPEQNISVLFERLQPNT